MPDPDPDQDRDALRKLRFSRIRRVKRMLRFLPRRTNVHRYPVLNWFAVSARKRSYLWSFRRNEMIPALYAGWVLTLLPLYGLQLILGFFVAIGLRANLMVITGLQLVSNPLTVLPIWYLNYQVGNFFLDFFLEDSPVRYGKMIGEASDLGLNFRETFSFILERTRESGASVVTDIFGRWIGGTFLGGVLLGLLAGFISVVIYRVLLKRYSSRYEKIAGDALRGNSSAKK